MLPELTGLRAGAKGWCTLLGMPFAPPVLWRRVRGRLSSSNQLLAYRAQIYFLWLLRYTEQRTSYARERSCAVADTGYTEEMKEPADLPSQCYELFICNVQYYKFKNEVLGGPNRLLSLIRHGPHTKRRVHHFFYCCVCIRYRRGIFTEPLPSNDKGIHMQTRRLIGIFSLLSLFWTRSSGKN
jgi:hypothetical protein